MPLTNVSGRKVYCESHGSAADTPRVLVMGMAGEGVLHLLAETH